MTTAIVLAIDKKEAEAASAAADLLLNDIRKIETKMTDSEDRDEVDRLRLDFCRNSLQYIGDKSLGFLASDGDGKLDPEIDRLIRELIKHYPHIKDDKVKTTITIMRVAQVHALTAELKEIKDKFTNVEDKISELTRGTLTSLPPELKSTCIQCMDLGNQFIRKAESLNPYTDDDMRKKIAESVKVMQQKLGHVADTIKAILQIETIAASQAATAEVG